MTGAVIAGGYQRLVCTLSPDIISESRSGAGSITSSACTATVTNGTGSYSYSWTRDSGDTEITANSPSGVSTTFDTTVNTSDVFSAIFRCTATDNETGAQAFDTVSVTLFEQT